MSENKPTWEQQLFNEQRDGELKEEDQETCLKFYKGILKHLKRCEFEPTPAEAVYIRKLVAEVWNENKTSSPNATTTPKILWLEVIHRFLLDYYGINQEDYMSGIKEEYGVQAIKDLFRLIKEKYRPERELI